MTSDVTIIESEIEIAIFFENRTESKSVFCQVFLSDFDSGKLGNDNHTGASSKHDSQRCGMLNVPSELHAAAAASAFKR